MDDEPRTLGGLLRDARERLARCSGLRVRQADVAELADITVEWYARIERGAVLPSFDVLSRVAVALSLSSQERVEALRCVVPGLLRRDDIDPPSEPASGATRELRAHRRFHRRAESASTPDELVDMAVTAVMDGIPHVVFPGFMSKSATRWRHRSTVRPDLAEVVNASAPLDDRSIQKSTLGYEGLRFVGSPDYGASSSPHLCDRSVHTELRSGFGVRIPMSDGFLGYCHSERGAPKPEHILLLGGISNILALTMRGSSFSPGEPRAIRTENAAP